MSIESAPLEKGIGKNFRYDFPSGVVVFLVALPLCLGIALASGAPLMSGLVTGVVGGLVVTLISGSPLSVSGPAAGLASIVAVGIQDFGFEAFLVAVVIAGLMQTALGLFRLGILAEFFPLSVIKGMLAAIGIILILKQIPYALGGLIDGEKRGYFDAIFHAFETASTSVIIVTAVSLVILVLWERPFIKAQSWSRILPGPLVAVVSGLALNELFKLAMPDFEITSQAKQLVDLPELLYGAGFAEFQLPNFDTDINGALITLAATIAAVASIETLLCVEATDKLDPFKRVTPTNRELVAQGVGNTISGLIGGLPMTAVIVRSSANIYAGGRTRAAAWSHGALLLGLVLAVPFLLNLIPLAALAAVLLVVGYKLARISLFKQMWSAGFDQFLPFITTIIVTVAVDLLIGVTTGLVVGIFMLVFTKVSYSDAVTLSTSDEGAVIRLSKDVSFINKAKLKAAFAAVPDGSSVMIDGSAAGIIDRDIQEAIKNFQSSAGNRDITVETAGLDTLPHPLSFRG
ncbi:MAG: solute carrier family 23 protein [Myxococcota bacterium]|nr:solute carrier family 23 protein [Myxococcota bacterium]